MLAPYTQLSRTTPRVCSRLEPEPLGFRAEAGTRTTARQLQRVFVVAAVWNLSPQRLQVMVVTAPIIAPCCAVGAASFGSTPVSASSSELEPRRSCQAEEPGTTDVHRSGAECQSVGDVACTSNRSVGLDRSGQATRRSSLFSICSAWSLNLRFSPAKNPKTAYASSAVPARATPVSVTPTQA